ncbi:asparaginase [Dongshaea marina]|uniref:asparaginase n=1 Tax=Dongshaea marina TaxID=2047966 RepID=UPI00131F1A76|nr:asparaginase [Dongshaea marina]
MAKLPNIVILGTGGTIAGAAPSTEQTIGYRSGQLSVGQLLQDIPGAASIANIQGEQVFNICSRAMNPQKWLELGKRVQSLLNRDDIDGIVVTHGTNSLEETAYFLHLMIDSKKPIVITGAMRPATAISADGPMNLLQAIAVCACPQSRERGVLVVMNDKIFNAREVTKHSTTNLDTMIAPGYGQLGTVDSGLVSFNCSSDKLHTFRSCFDIMSINELPKVDIVYNYAGCGKEPVLSFIDSAKGIISAGFGDGALSEELLEGLICARADNIQIVRSSRTGSGLVLKNGDEDDDGNQFIVAHDLNPQKARVLLMVALTKTDDWQQIQQYFYQY